MLFDALALRHPDVRSSVLPPVAGPSRRRTDARATAAGKPPVGALKGSRGVTPCLLGAGHTGGDLGLVPLVQARIGWLPAGFSLCVIRISNDRLLEPCSDCTLGNPTSCVRTKHNALTCGSSWWARKARITLPLQQLPAPRNGTFMRALRAHMPNSSLPSGLQTRAR